MVARRLRFEVLRRDGHTCRYCGAKAPDVVLHVDHVVPVVLGGGDEPSNLVTACEDCNLGKASVPAEAAIVEDVDATAMLFAKAMERASMLRSIELGHVDDVCAAVCDAWAEWDDDLKYLPGDYRSSIERFLESGLIEADIERYLRVAFASRVYATKVWRYFCGCCWNEIGRRQEMARQMIEDGVV